MQGSFCSLKLQGSGDLCPVIEIRRNLERFIVLCINIIALMGKVMYVISYWQG